MIDAIIAKDFKGLSFECPISQYTLFVGNNGAGKSARTQALTLAIMGYLPQDQKKRAGDIFETHSFQGKPFAVGFKKGEESFGRVFEKDQAGAVTQKVSHNKKAVKSAQVEKALYTLGDPKVFDLKAFVDLSDQKKIDYIFDLYPPEGNLSEIDAEIERLAEQEKRLNADHKALLTAAERLTQEIASIETPAGTLPEIKGKIASLEKNLTEAQELLRAEELAENQRQTEERVKREMEAKQREQEQTRPEPASPDPRPAPAREFAPRTTTEPRGLFDNDQASPHEPLTTKPQPTGDIVADLERIQTTMSNAGCSACAAMIKIKLMLKKYRKQEAA